MMRRFAAALLLATLLPSSSYAGSGTATLYLSVGSGSGVPPGAQSAGFTTLALNSDFTQQMPSNWLGGCATAGNGAAVNTGDLTGHLWWMNIWWSNTYLPCNTVQKQDPDYGGLVLDMPWLVDTSAENVGSVIQSAPWFATSTSGGGITFPNNAYYEMTYRLAPVGAPAANTPGSWGGLFTWPLLAMTDNTKEGFEFDLIEQDVGNLNNTDQAVHNWAVNPQDSAFVWLGYQGLPLSYNPFVYHTFGLRTVTDGTTMTVCGFLDNAALPCTSKTMQPNNQTEREFLIVQNACDYWNYNVPCSSAATDHINHMYVKSVRVFSCSSWQTTQCNLQSVTGISISNPQTTTGLPSGTAVGTLSVALNPPTPVFSYTGSNLHLSASGTDSGGVCNSTNGAANGAFQIINGDTLATNGALTAGAKQICVAAVGGSTPSGQAFTITVGNRIDAATGSGTGGCTGNGTSASPWNYLCIQNAAKAAAPGDTVFLAAGYWSLKTSDATYVTIDKSINLVGVGSGNTFDAWGHINNANGTELCTGSTVTITCIQETGTSYCLIQQTSPPCTATTATGGSGPPPAGFIKFGSDDPNDTACTNINISHIFWDGSLATDGGDFLGLLYMRFCNGVTINDIRHLTYNQKTIPVQFASETQVYPFELTNVSVLNSLFAEPASGIAGGSYGNTQVLQPTEGSTFLGPWNVTNNVFYQQEFNPILTTNMTYYANVQYAYNDGSGVASHFYGYGVAGDTLGGTRSNYGCWPYPSNPSGTCNGSYHINSNNNLFYGKGLGFPMVIGGSVNDPSTNGGLNDYNFAGNWIIGDNSAIAACTANLNGGCPDVGMTINAAVDLSCTATNNGTPFNITNNSIIATGNSYIDGQGVGTASCYTGASRTARVNIPAVVYGLNAQNNYLQSSSNNYLTNANTISPVQQNNYCNGAVGTWGGGSACNTAGFTNAPTGVSFTLGSLGLGGIVPINNPTATAQYGAVQWLTARCAAPCSSPPAAPLSSDSRWSSNNGSFPNSAANSYIPPVSLSGVSHGDSVYLWVMDSANHISAAAPALIP